MATIKELLTNGTEALLATSSTARLDTELLLAHVLGMSRSGLISHYDEEVDIECEKVIEKLTARRAEQEPIANIVGYKEFWGLDFIVSDAVLIPRPESEMIVEHGIAALEHTEDPVRVLDLGTGSGCLAISIANELNKTNRNFTVVAVDRDEEALAIARKNIETHKLDERIDLRRGDWFKGLPGSHREFHLIVSNPPYIAEGDANVGKEISYEPDAALYSGGSGLEAIEKILSGVCSYLASGGTFLCEIGSEQRGSVSKLIKNLKLESGEKPIRYSIEKDLAGLDRLLVVQHAS